MSRKTGMRLLSVRVPEDVLKEFKQEIDRRYGTRWGKVEQEVTEAIKMRTKALSGGYVKGVRID